MAVIAPLFAFNQDIRIINILWCYSLSSYQANSVFIWSRWEHESLVLLLESVRKMAILRISAVVSLSSAETPGVMRAAGISIEKRVPFLL